MFELAEGGKNDSVIVVLGSVGDEFEEDGQTELVQRGRGRREGVEEGGEGCVSGREGRVRRAVGREGNGIGEGEDVGREVGVLDGEKAEDEREDEVGESFKLFVGRLESRVLDALEDLRDDFPFRLAGFLRFLDLLVLVAFLFFLGGLWCRRLCFLCG